MIEWLSRNRNTLVPLGLLLLSLIVLSRNSMIRHRNDISSSHFARGITASASYIQRGITFSITGIRDLGRNYIFLTGLREENLRLQKQIALLTMENLGLNEQAIENERLKRLLEFKDTVSYRLVPAQVIAGDLSATSKVIYINKGRKDGLKPGMAVVTYEGIIGQVLDEPGRPLSRSSAPVLLILDRMSHADVMIQRSRERGVIHGRPESQDLELLYMESLADIKIGDVAITTGMGSVYPKGLKVGTITSVEYVPGALSPKVKVEPGVEFFRLEETLIIFPEEENP